MNQIPFPRSKSYIAFRWTAEKLFDTSKHVYFWTFTFKNVYCDWQYSAAWRQLVVAMRYHYAAHGVRVIEPHKMHGLHYHALASERIPIEFIRRVGPRYGFGIPWVEKADRGAIDYLGKYLSKGFKSDPLYGGISRWGTWGGFTAVKKNDVVIDAPAQNTMRWFSRHLGKLPFAISHLIFLYVTHYGQLEEWTFETTRKFLAVLFAGCGKKWLHACYQVQHILFHHHPERDFRTLRERIEHEQIYSAVRHSLTVEPDYVKLSVKSEAVEALADNPA